MCVSQSAGEPNLRSGASSRFGGTLNFSRAKKSEKTVDFFFTDCFKNGRNAEPVLLVRSHEPGIVARLVVTTISI